MHRKSERADVRVILNEIDLLDEQRWRFDRSSLRSRQAASVGVDVNPALEQAGAFLPWLQLIDVHQASFQPVRPLIREFVVRGTDRIQRGFILLHMVHFGLQQTDDDIGFHEAISGESHGFERQRTRGRVVLLHFVFAKL